ncbi:40S ribosomal protein S27 [Trichonephila clavipes]|nr:40S ribosomal protein S27 [Trichonephila clavipes]
MPPVGCSQIETCEIHCKGPVIGRSLEHHTGDKMPSPNIQNVAAVAEWYRYRIVACLVTSSSPVPLKTRRVQPRTFKKMPLAKDLLHPNPDVERRKCKLKRLVQHPNSFFMDVKCPGCYKITTVFSHAQTVVLCVGCSTVLCQPTGGRARLTEGCSFRKKQH